MNRSSLSVLAKALASKNNMPLADAELFIKQMFDVANNVLQADKQLKIRWLGTFKVMAVKDRESIDVNTGERIIIGGRDKISFTPDNILKEIVNKPFAQFETVVVNEGVDFSEIDNKFSEDNNISVAVNETMSSPQESSVSSQKKAEDKLRTNEQPESEKVAIPKDIKNKEEVETNKVKKEDTDSHESLKAPDDQNESTIVSSKNVQVSENEENNDTSLEETNSDQEDIRLVNVVKDETKTVVGESQESSSNSKENSVKNADSINSNEEKNSTKEQPESAISNKRYMVFPRYAIVIAVIVVLALIGGIGWFSFNYGKMEAQRNHLAMQLADIQKKRQLSLDSVKADEQQKALIEKAAEDSLRMLKASKAVEANSDKVEESKFKKDSIKSEHKQTEQKETTQYDKDPRVRTGAYRIIGIDKTITAKNGQTLENLSKLYLGPGMECYMEAVNGTSDIKVGQKVKIPKLELKRKK